MFRTLTPALSIIAAVAIYFLFIKPQYADIQLVNQERASYEQAAQDYANFTHKIDALEARRNAVSLVERDRLDQFLPASLDAAQSFVDLQAAAQRANLLFGNVALGEDTSTNGAQPAVQYDEFGNPVSAPAEPVYADLSFAVIGTYDQFKAFLTEIEKSLTLFEVTKIEAEASHGQLMQFDMTVRTYAMPLTQP